MIIGLVADTHDNLPALEGALARLGAAGATRLLHAGDVTTPETVRRLAGWAPVIALGNNDGFRDLAQAAASVGGAVAEDALEGVVDGVPVAACHGHRRGTLRSLVESGRFRLVVTGHTHVRRDDLVGATRVVNPGALYRAREYTCAAYDTVTGRVTFLSVPKDVSGR